MLSWNEKARWNEKQTAKKTLADAVADGSFCFKYSIVHDLETTIVAKMRC